MFFNFSFFHHLGSKLLSSFCCGRGQGSCGSFRLLLGHFGGGYMLVKEVEKLVHIIVRYHSHVVVWVSGSRAFWGRGRKGCRGAGVVLWSFDN